MDTDSQGSAATLLRCGGQCNNHFVATFLMNIFNSEKI